MYKHQKKNRLICLQKNYKFLILNATDRKAILLEVEVAEHIAIIGVQAAVISVTITALC